PRLHPQGRAGHAPPRLPPLRPRRPRRVLRHPGHRLDQPTDPRQPRRATHTRLPHLRALLRRPPPPPSRTPDPRRLLVGHQHPHALADQRPDARDRPQPAPLAMSFAGERRPYCMTLIATTRRRPTTNHAYVVPVVRELAPS